MLLKSGYRSILALATTSLLAVMGTTGVRAGDHCSAYGPDFTSVAGSDACVRIGGRVRVEFGFRRLPNPFANDGQIGSHPAAMRSGAPLDQPDDMSDGIEQGHVRLHSLDTPGQPDPFH